MRPIFILIGGTVAVFIVAMSAKGPSRPVERRNADGFFEITNAELRPAHQRVEACLIRSALGNSDPDDPGASRVRAVMGQCQEEVDALFAITNREVVGRAPRKNVDRLFHQIKVDFHNLIRRTRPE